MPRTPAPVLNDLADQLRDAAAAYKARKEAAKEAGRHLNGLVVQAVDSGMSQLTVAGLIGVAKGRIIHAIIVAARERPARTRRDAGAVTPRPLHPLLCQRDGCPHAYPTHAPGGGNCRSAGCGCPGFQFVPLRSEPAAR
jgi:hypothetical protein